MESPFFQGIDTAEVRAFEEITTIASERQILRIADPTMLASNDVLNVKSCER
jgi:hypothetical protein